MAVSGVDWARLIVAELLFCRGWRDSPLSGCAHSVRSLVVQPVNHCLGAVVHQP